MSVLSERTTVLLAGGALAVLVLAGSVQEPEEGPTVVEPLQPGATMVRGLPAAHQMFRIREGEPKRVPTARYLVVTGAAVDRHVDAAGSRVRIRFDGEQLLECALGPDGLVELPTGLAAGPATIVSVESEPKEAKALLFGYLEDA